MRTNAMGTEVTGHRGQTHGVYIECLISGLRREVINERSREKGLI